MAFRVLATCLVMSTDQESWGIQDPNSQFKDEFDPQTGFNL